MKNTNLCHHCLFGILFFLILSLSSCFTARKMNKNVADYYGNEIPKISKKEIPQISITTSLPFTGQELSTSIHETKMLPLIVYWSIDDRLVSTLNPRIPFNNFHNTVVKFSAKELVGKLNGRRIELSLDQAPLTFAINDNVKVILLVIHWQKVSVMPVMKDMVVSYKLYNGDQIEKTGSITVKDNQTNFPLRFFQTIKSGTAEYLDFYTGHISIMTQKLLDELMKEL